MSCFNFKCYECGGPCRPRDVKKVGHRIGRGKVYRGKARYKKHWVCDFCRRGSGHAFEFNVLREEIRRR